MRDRNLQINFILPRKAYYQEVRAIWRARRI